MSSYATGDLGKREARAVISTVGTLGLYDAITEGKITAPWSEVVKILVDALTDFNVTLQAGGLDRMIANVYTDVADTYTRDLAAKHLHDAIMFDTNNGEF